MTNHTCTGTEFADFRTESRPGVQTLVQACGGMLFRCCAPPASVLALYWGSGFAFIAHDTATLPFVVVERFVAAARKPAAHRRFLGVAQRRPSSRTSAAYLFAAGKCHQRLPVLESVPGIQEPGSP